jgi:hypothetical protein
MYYLDNQIKEDAIGGTCSTLEGDEKRIKSFRETTGDHLGGQGADERTNLIFKWIFKK